MLVQNGTMGKQNFLFNINHLIPESISTSNINIFAFHEKVCLTTVFTQISHRGFPMWLHFIPGIVMRTDNEPFKVRFYCFQY